MENQLTTIATFKYSTEADVCCAVLEAAGISSLVVDNSLVGGLFSTDVFGGFKVQVTASEVEKALEVMQSTALEQGTLKQVPDDSPEIEFICEFCRKPVTFPATEAGKVQECPHCAEYLDVPTE